MGQENETRWKLFCKPATGNYYAREIGGQRRTITLETKDKDQAEINMRLKLGQEMLPEENAKHLELGKAHLNLVNPELTKRTWGELMNRWAGGDHLSLSTKDRREKELSRGVFPLLKDRLLCDTTVEELVLAHGKMGIFARSCMRSMINEAKRLGWMLHDMVAATHLKVHKSERMEKRAITQDEFDQIIEAERATLKNKQTLHAQEKVDFYTLLWLTGAAQTDGATLKASNVNWDKMELRYTRAKTGERCAITISGTLEALLKRLPKRGPLFPFISKQEAKYRACDFKKRCQGLGIEGISLHSFRYHMAEWCCEVGMEMRFAQLILGHSSKTVAIAYSRKTQKAAPSPESYQTTPAEVIDGRSLVAA